MRILMVHNYYEQPGGEDAVVRSEYELLEKNHQEVSLYKRSNAEIKSFSLAQRIKFLTQLEWSRQSYQQLRRRIREFRPDIVHFHNIFYLITASAYDACHDEGVPVVQSQHNFRPLCSNGLFFRDNAVCEECLDHSLWRGVRYGCFKGSRLATLPMARMLMAHQKKGTWPKKVDRYIMATEFTRRKYVQAGIPENKISLKPHFVFSPSARRTDQGYALYIGRLSSEKGVDVLVKAWQTLSQIPLKIIGSGPLAVELSEFARQQGMDQVQFLGYVSAQQYESNLKGAMFLVLPSVCYENFPRVVVEAYSCGVPILASRLGSVAELVKDGQTGVTFTPGNENDLREKARWLVDHPREREQMGQGAQRLYDEKFTAQKNYEALMAIYHQTIEDYKGSRR